LDFASDRAWKQALLGGNAFLDIRAPIEFFDGSLPGAINIPILSDQERHQIGVYYKQHGPEAAVKLGHTLVSGSIKADRVNKWIQFTKQNPDSLLYCFRGGRRSEIAQQWLRESGIRLLRISGGYKAVRQYLLSALDSLPAMMNIFCLSGQTGAGKTKLLRDLNCHCNVIDLEDLAKHRGSAFGKEFTPQPSQSNFENLLAVEILRAEQRAPAPLILEDEARTIGKIVVPSELFKVLRSSPLVVIDESRDSRSHHILQEYVIEPYSHLKILDQEAALERLRERLIGPVDKIGKKLGMGRVTECKNLIEAAILQGTDWSAHLQWINFLLENYYDAYYKRHLQRQSERIVFQGNRLEVFNYLQDLTVRIGSELG